MPWLCWELLFSMLCMHCMNKGSSLNLDLMISSNYIVIMITLMSICVYQCMYVMSNKVIMDHDYFMLMFYACMYIVDRLDHYYFMLMFICMYVYVCISLSDRVMIIYANVYVYVCMYPCIYVAIQQGHQGSFLWKNDCLCR